MGSISLAKGDVLLGTRGPEADDESEEALAMTSATRNVGRRPDRGPSHEPEQAGPSLAPLTVGVATGASNTLRTASCSGTSRACR